MRIVKWVAAAVCCVAVSVAQATAEPPPSESSGVALGIGISSLGLLGELSLKAHSNFVVRLNGNWFGYDHDLAVDANTYNGSATVWGAGLIGDWHPFQNGFRLSGGVRYHSALFEGSISGASITVNGTTYAPADYGKLTARVENGNPFTPYIGLGWDSAHFTGSRFTVGLDVGVLYMGDPRAKLTSTVTNPGLQSDLDAELDRLKAEYSKFGQFWPVLSLAAKYRF